MERNILIWFEQPKGPLGQSKKSLLLKMEVKLGPFGGWKMNVTLYWTRELRSKRAVLNAHCHEGGAKVSTINQVGIKLDFDSS